MAKDNRAAFLAALRDVQPQVATAFEAAIADIRSTAQARAIEAAIERGMATGNIERAVQEVVASLQLGAEFFAPLDRSIAEAFEAGAVYQLSALPKKPLPNTGPLLVRFQGRHPRAEAWTRQAAGALITEITGDIPTLIRESIVTAIEESRGHRSLTEDLIGTPEGNQRTGGLIGLHSSQARAVLRARRELGRGDFTAYRRRKTRDKRFDRTLDRVAREGAKLTRSEIDKITGRYADRLLKERGKRIASTEGNRAMNEGRAESIRQMIESGKITSDVVTKIWDATPGIRTRDSHSALNGVEAAWDAPFVSPVTGALLDHPHDTSHGAPASETVNCRCSARFRINFAALAQ